MRHNPSRAELLGWSSLVLNQSPNSSSRFFSRSLLRDIGKIPFLDLQQASAAHPRQNREKILRVIPLVCDAYRCNKAKKTIVDVRGSPCLLSFCARAPIMSNE